MEGVAIGNNFQREPPKDDGVQVWFKLAQWFQRRTFLKKFTDGRRTPVMAIAHTGELKT
jgi:hypothetical protein